MKLFVLNKEDFKEAMQLRKFAGQMTKDVGKSISEALAEIVYAPMAKDIFTIGGVFGMEHWRNGKLLDKQFAHNLVVNEGRTYILNTIYKNTVRSDPWYVLLTATATPLVGWTAANQGSTWNEFTSYSEATRQEFVDGAISSFRIDNTASQATFNVTSSGTVNGAGLSDVSVKGGTTGNLLCATDFATARVVDSPDIINITYTVGVDDDGA